MVLEFIWWCNECEVEVDSPEVHSGTYPNHTYTEKMRWEGNIFSKKPLSKDIHVVFGSDTKNYFRIGEVLQVQPKQL